MKKYIIIAAFLLPISVLAQTPSVKKADKAFKSFSYPKVIEKLEGKKDISTNAVRELAASYAFVGQYAKAEETYARLSAAPDKIPTDLYDYAQVLKMNGKYNEAITQLDAYAALQSNDKRVQLVKKDIHYMDQLLKDKGQFTIKNLDMNSAAQDFGATYFKDKVVYTSSSHLVSASQRKWNGNNLDFLDLHVANANETHELTNSKLLNNVNKKYHEGPASYDSSGTIAFFTVDNYKNLSSDGVRKLELFESKFKDNKWEKLIPFPLNNKEYSVGHAALNAAGNVLYFASDMPGGKGGVDIYKITRNADGTWGTAENLGDKINTEGNEMFPFYHESGYLFFASNGLPGLGGLDVFTSKITNGQYSEPQNLGVPINSTKDDFSFVLNKNQSSGYFASNREDGKGDDDIYSFNMLKKFNAGKVIKGVAQDKEGNILANTNVNLYDESGNILKTVLTGENGAYSFDVADKKDFKLNGTKEKYFEGKNVANTRGDEEIVIADVILEKDPGNALRMLVTDGKTKEPLDGVKYKITDVKTGEVFMQDVTPASGEALKPLADKKINDQLAYKIELVKDGYFPKTVDFKHTILKPGIINAHESLDLSMDREVKDLRDLVVINDIRFDLNKFNIRPDAAAELDKVVAVMNKYPGMEIELGSHTDCRAPIKYNEVLSDKRAKASAAYIKTKITNPARIYGKGYGESVLLNGCACEGAVKSTCSEEEHQKNRRTEFKIISMGAGVNNVDVKNNSTNSFDKKK